MVAGRRGADVLGGSPPPTALCRCGHAPDWHSHAGAGDCEHDGECGCKQFDAASSSRDLETLVKSNEVEGVLLLDGVYTPRELDLIRCAFDAGVKVGKQVRDEA